MPIKDEIGFGAFTDLKHTHFDKLINMHINITMAVIDKYNIRNKSDYKYIDCTSGSGFYEGHTGSPVIALNAMLPRGRKFVLELIESNEVNINQLKLNISKSMERVDSGVIIINFHNERYQNVLSNLTSSNTGEYGMLYIDTSGDLPELEHLAKFSEMRPKMEILIYISPTNVKRSAQFTNIELVDYVNKIDKNNWLIRKPQDGDHHQWTFLLGTNSKGLFKDYKSVNMFDIKGKTGQQILTRLNLTNKKLRTYGMENLFEDETD
jgi:hypothetical protein